MIGALPDVVPISISGQIFANIFLSNIQTGHQSHEEEQSGPPERRSERRSDASRTSSCSGTQSRTSGTTTTAKL